MLAMPLIESAQRITAVEDKFFQKLTILEDKVQEIEKKWVKKSMSVIKIKMIQRK